MTASAQAMTGEATLRKITLSGLSIAVTSVNVASAITTTPSRPSFVAIEESGVPDRCEGSRDQPNRRGEDVTFICTDECERCEGTGFNEATSLTDKGLFHHPCEFCDGTGKQHEGESK